MMPSTLPAVEDTLTAGLYQQIQQFYALQMQMLNAGSVDAWADSFTEDGVFTANAHPEPTRGRAAIRAAAQRTADDLVAGQLIRRHWLGMLAMTPQDDGTVFVRSYAQVLETARGETTKLLMSTVCEDVLVREGSWWLVRDRRVSRDDIA